MKSQFLLDPKITYLNHGSFGACPKPIFEDYQSWQRKLETEPVQFITKESLLYLRQSKQTLAEFIGCSAEDFFFTPNPTIAVNTIMRSLKLNPGDEILATNHEYGAMDRIWNFYCKKSGAKYIRQKISIPVVSKEQILSEFWSGYTENTKVIFINQISSATALIFPVAEICRRAKELGLLTIVDGAHVPGHIGLDIRNLDPDFYTGTTHKWLLTPKGCSFLYVAKRFQEIIEPLIVSWGYESESQMESTFLDYHEIQGTRDTSAFLTIPAALRFWQENNLQTRIEESKQLILENYKGFCDLLKTEPICPVTPEFLGQMCSIPIKTRKPIELKELLYGRYNIELPVMTTDTHQFLRISVNVYNTQADMEILRFALEDIVSKTNFMSFGT